MDQATKYKIVKLVNRIDNSALVMGFYKQAGRIMQQSVEENKQAWKELIALLDVEIMKGEKAK